MSDHAISHDNKWGNKDRLINDRESLNGKMSGWKSQHKLWLPSDQISEQISLDPWTTKPKQERVLINK